MALVKNKHLKLYKEYTEQLNEDLGIPVEMVGQTVTSQCPNCIYDRVHKCSSGKYNGTGPQPFTGGICPVCKGEGELATDSITTVKCTVNWGNLNESKEFVSSPGGDSEYNYFKIKALVAYYDTIKNAKYIVIDGVRTELCNIIKRGLKENVVCVAICKRQD